MIPLGSCGHPTSPFRLRELCGPRFSRPSVRQPVHRHVNKTASVRCSSEACTRGHESCVISHRVMRWWPRRPVRGCAWAPACWRRPDRSHPFSASGIPSAEDDGIRFPEAETSPLQSSSILAPRLSVTRCQAPPSSDRAARSVRRTALRMCKAIPQYLVRASSWVCRSSLSDFVTFKTQRTAVIRRPLLCLNALFPALLGQ